MGYVDKAVFLLLLLIRSGTVLWRSSPESFFTKKKKKRQGGSVARGQQNARRWGERTGSGVEPGLSLETAVTKLTLGVGSP